MEDPGFWASLWDWIVWALWWGLSITWWVLLWNMGKAYANRRTQELAKNNKTSLARYHGVRSGMREDWRREFETLIEGMGGPNQIQSEHFTAICTLFTALEAASDPDVANTRLASSGITREEFDQIRDALWRQADSAVDQVMINSESATLAATLVATLAAEAAAEAAAEDPPQTRGTGKRVVEL